MSVQGYWADLPARAFRHLPANTIAVLPLGATEQHGPHLPLSVDSDIISAVAAGMLERLHPEQSVLVLPLLAITKSDEHAAYPGTLTLSADTLLAVIRQIGRSVAAAGVERLVLFNGHGGNTALLQVAARDLRRDQGLIVVTCSWSSFADWSEWDRESLSRDIHAGDSETSAMLALKPEAVAMDRARSFRSALDDWEQRFPEIGVGGKPVQPGWLAQDLNVDGACGDAASATAQKGAALIESASCGFATFLGDFASFDHRRPIK